MKCDTLPSNTVLNTKNNSHCNSIITQNDKTTMYLSVSTVNEPKNDIVHVTVEEAADVKVE